MQTKVETLIETIMSVIGAFILSLLLQIFLAWYYYKVFTFRESVEWVIWFTALALIRSYWFRRFFNWMFYWLRQFNWYRRLNG